MPIKDIKQYALLRYQGDVTMDERLNMLERHRLMVLKEVEKWELNLKHLEEKISFYKSKITT